MRQTILATCLLGFCSVCGCESKPATIATTEGMSQPAIVKAAIFNVDGAPTVAFNVPEMMCEKSCVPQVREALAAQPGVKDVEVVLANKTATVAVNERQFDPQAAIAALKDLRFDNAALVTPSSGAQSAN